MHRRDHSVADGLLFERNRYVLVVRPPGACRMTIPSQRHFLDIHLGKSDASYEISGEPLSEESAPPSTFVFLPSAGEREIRATRSGWSIQLSFEPDLIFVSQGEPDDSESAEDTTALKTQLHQRDDTLMAIANQLAGCWLPDQKRPSDVQIEAIVTLLLMRLKDRISDEKREPPRRTAVSPRIQRVLDHIERDLCATHTLKSLADIAGVSTYHFARMFLAATGRRPHQYVVERRLAHAKRRLKQSDDAIVEIALDCGFASQSHMTEVFTKTLGTTPGKVRRSAP